jgi:5,10-methylene-tetrahydrofolate dehydrogenase/methenyl tetrahydrofolate cyclohydrolase
MHMAEMMYGKPVADRIEQGVRAEIEQLLKNHNVIPRLDVVLVGKNAASLRYVGKENGILPAHGHACRVA